MSYTLSQRWQGIKQITRIDKPIGTYLLLWPTYWALWIAAEGFPSLHLLFVFTLGVFLMRSAGCVINDFADRKVDGEVKRTNQRPLVTGLISPEQAILLFVCLLAAAFGLVTSLSWYTIQLSFIAVFLATLYPFMKRYTNLPQVVLGAAFSWGMIMAFAEVMGYIPLAAWFLFFANLTWTVAYDTMYAMVDRDDDLRIGVKSTAILFGENDKKIIGFLQILTLGLLYSAGELLAFGWPFHLSLIIAAGFFCYQQMLIVDRNRDKCFAAFLNNHFVGMIIFVAILIEYF
ncbi:4-hydroxybenzoate octaprenyltransferase [Thalassotalea eurytherma]|uniref:4-hydroxybenzoate octaprenyltransferase n=1 Tax=Thalassotalea eurytherma TaxID=1144278 RepID=A0ABQ6H5I2_9GAMM|nr:4-hydroxybenzoate octaprenyltransferase [Thalassotalea eurytherma]GLX82126.1 4-hydroxybenzoate octaprenyltransferase [Thalassotalea eurytherma]